eukprot:TRINITY_DN64962_c0_g1_i1.p1 TRINITY_DN64962_c0_g1~~TRINITY_DN64962_c0_g1_i1.p1  ORF type:complete len:268 (+),score=79.47 TRINITY_DN64962_c0_g1_i1:103-804(+)
MRGVAIGVAALLALTALYGAAGGFDGGDATASPGAAADVAILRRRLRAVAPAAMLVPELKEALAEVPALRAESRQAADIARHNHDAAARNYKAAESWKLRSEAAEQQARKAGVPLELPDVVVGEAGLQGGSKLGEDESFEMVRGFITLNQPSVLDSDEGRVLALGEAKALCSASRECAGFTFKGDPGHDEDERKVYFKGGWDLRAVEGWVAYRHKRGASGNARGGAPALLVPS